MSGPPFRQIPNEPFSTFLQLNRSSNSRPSIYLSPFTTAAVQQPPPQMRTSTYPPGSASYATDAYQQPKSISELSYFAFSAYVAAMNSSIPFPMPPQPVYLSTFKGFKFVTLDHLQIETREIYDEISGTYRWENCECEDDRCIKYIRETCAKTRVFLICSGSLGERVVPIVHGLPQVYAIYIYCQDVSNHLKWAGIYDKVRVVCNDDDKYLLPQLAVDVAQANIDWGDALLQANKRDEAKMKFEKALTNLNNYVRKSDAAVVDEVKRKLERCTI